MLTRKHYHSIAEIFKQNLEEIKPIDSMLAQYGWACIACVAEELADYFEKDNPRFDRDRFLEACGVE